MTPVMLHDMESSNHRECMPDTCAELLSEIINWLLSSSHQNMYWLFGIPGTGKSTIAQTIARHPQIVHLLVSQIIFKRENTRRHDILKLIAYRLALSNAKIAEEIASRLHRPRHTLRDSFVNFILEPLQEAEKAGHLQDTIVIILDALDEYGTSESRVPFMQLLRNEFFKLPRQVRILITSRPEADLVRSLSSQTHIVERKLDHDTEASRHDVSSYITTEMKKLVSPKSSTGRKWEELMTVLSQAADGLFIWAAVVVKLVQSSSLPYKKICTLARNGPKLTLDDLYGKALRAIDMDWDDADNRQLFSVLFSIILPNRGSPTIELFDLLLELTDDTSETHLFKLQSFILFSTQSPIQIHHKTFADYLLSPSRRPREPWYINMSQQNSLIVRQCFAAMGQLHFDMCGAVTRPGNDEVAIGDIQPHILYACLYWADHLKNAEFSNNLLKDLNAFLENRFFFWLEVLSHLKELSRVASQALFHASNWVTVSS